MEKTKVKCKKCDAPATHRGTKLCAKHHDERRAKQNAGASKKWQKRIKDGKVKFKPFYKETPTPAALAEPSKARAALDKLAKKDPKKAAKRLAALEKALKKEQEQKAKEQEQEKKEQEKKEQEKKAA